MKEKKSKQKGTCDGKEASTLAAGSIAQYFTENNWKIISFFPNSPCAQNQCLKGEILSEKNKKKPLKNTHK